MATAGAKPVELVKVGVVTLEDARSNYPEYTSVAVLSADRLVVLNRNGCTLQLHNCHNGKLLAVYKLKAEPHDVCVVDMTQIHVAVTQIHVAVTLTNGQIEMLSVEPAAINLVRTLDVMGEFKYCYGVRALKTGEKLLVSGGKEEEGNKGYWICWGLCDKYGKVKIFKICQSDGPGYGSSSYLATSADGSTVYISCWTGPRYEDNNGVYAFDVMDGSQKFKYHHSDLTKPKGIAVDGRGFIYVCNLSPSCIHQLTERMEIVAIHRKWIDEVDLVAICWEKQKEELYVTILRSREVWRLQPQCSDQQVILSKMPSQKSSSTSDEQLRMPSSEEALQLWAKENDITAGALDELLKEGFSSFKALKLLDRDDLVNTKILQGQKKLIIASVKQLPDSQNGGQSTTIQQTATGMNSVASTSHQPLTALSFGIEDQYTHAMANPIHANQVFPPDCASVGPANALNTKGFVHVRPSQSNLDSGMETLTWKDRKMYLQSATAGDHKTLEVLVSDERKPVIEETSTQIEEAIITAHVKVEVTLPTTSAPAAAAAAAAKKQSGASTVLRSIWSSFTAQRTKKIGEMASVSSMTGAPAFPAADQPKTKRILRLWSRGKEIVERDVLAAPPTVKPVGEKTADADTAKVDQGQSSVETEMPPSVPVQEDSEDDKREDRGLIHRWMRSLGLGRSQKKHANKYSQGEHKDPEVLVSDERKQPVTEKTLTGIEQDVVDQGQSSKETDMPPSVPVQEDSEDDKRGPVIPVEILRMDEKSIQLYKDALRDGKEKVYSIRIMVVGQYGVGKTTLIKRLLRQQVDISERKSTEGIDVYKHCCQIAVETGEWIVQHEDSDQLSRLQRLMKLLTSQIERPEVSGEQKGQTEVIYQRETTLEELHGPVHYSHSGDDDISARSSESDFEQEVDNAKNQPEESYSVKVDQQPLALEASGVNIQEVGRHVTRKGDSVMEILQLINKNADKLKKSIVEYAALSMWDFAGQYVFYTTHQTFLTYRAVYLLVTDLCQQFTDLVQDDECYFDTDGVRLCQVQDLVEVWLNSIHCCTPSSAAGTDPKPDTAVTSTAADTVLISHGASTSVLCLDTGIPVIPPVILVGTHVDKIREDKRQEVIDKYFQMICRILKDKPSLQHLVGFFAIDNTQFDPQLETLKKRIFQLASEQPYWGEEVPANWLPLEEALMKLKASGIKVIPYSLVVELNQAVGLIKTTEQLDLFLRFQHETGNILYFSLEVLREWIVLDPKWLIDALKSLVTAETFILNNNPAIRSKWFEFKDTGKLAPELIDAIWTKQNHPEFHDHKEIILQLMEKLNIVARPRMYSPDAEEVKVEGYFLAPCMLRQATPNEFIFLGPNSQQGSTSVLSFVFTGKFLPSPVFHRLLAACVSHWPIAKQKLKNLIFCGCCVFRIDLHHRLTILFLEHVIFVRVTRMGTTETTEMTPSSKLCIEVREFITKTLSSIIGYLGQNLQVELSIQCPKSDKYSVDCLIPVANLQGNVDVPCYFHDNSHVIMSHDVLKFWFKEEEHSDDKSCDPVSSAPASDTDRFMFIAYLLVDVGSKVLRHLLHHHTVTSTCSLDQYLANNRKNIDKLHNRNILHQSHIDVMFPPSGGNTNLEIYDITLLSILFNNIVPTLSRQEKNMIKSLREDRNEIYGHANSCKINISDYQIYWNSVSSTLMALCKQCGDPDFENEILLEIQRIQVTTIPAGSYLNILKTWFNDLQDLKSRVEALESKDTAPESEA